MRGPRSTNTTVVVQDQILVSKHHSPKEPGLLGEVIDSTAEAGKIADSLEHLVMSESKEVFRKGWGLVPGGVNLKKLQWPRWYHLSPKINNKKTRLKSVE